MNRLILGADGGGTKTECALCDETGRILARAVSGPSNPNGQPIEAAFGNLREAIGGALSKWGGLSAPAAVFAGVAGCAAPARERAFRQYLSTILPNAVSVRNGSDTVNCLSGGVGAGENGVIAISGTGSSCFARKRGEMLRVGGWGYLFDDAGSGFEMGRMALIRAMRARDGRGEATALTELCESRLGARLEEGLGALYEGGRTLIASFSRCVSDALLAGDPAAVAIIEENARGMAEQIRTAAGLLSEGREGDGIPVVLAGTLWKAMPAYAARVRELSGSLPRFVETERAPVYGAVLEAAADIGIQPDERFQKAFDESYAALVR